MTDFSEVDKKFLEEHRLQAVSNVIELKPDKQYLLVFTGDHVNEENVRQVLGFLRVNGIRGIGIGLTTGQELQVIEAPGKEQ